MAKGGVHDQIGHGFARYSVTADWSLPHFEKMLYDQAQLLGVYLDAYMVTKDEDMLDVVYDLADYMCKDALKHPGGGFYSSEDADSLYRKTDTEKRGLCGQQPQKVVSTLLTKGICRGCILRLDKEGV